MTRGHRRLRRRCPPTGRSSVIEQAELRLSQAVIPLRSGETPLRTANDVSSRLSGTRVVVCPAAICEDSWLVPIVNQVSPHAHPSSSATPWRAFCISMGYRFGLSRPTPLGISFLASAARSGADHASHSREQRTVSPTLAGRVSARHSRASPPQRGSAHSSSGLSALGGRCITPDFRHSVPAFCWDFSLECPIRNRFTVSLP